MGRIARQNKGQDKLRETCEYQMIFDCQGERQRVAPQMSEALVFGWPVLSRVR